MSAIICLGHSFKGKKKLRTLERRIEKSVELYKTGRGSKLIFTGGAAATDSPSEAKVMAQIATSLGVPSEDIILEERAITTVGNALCTKEILEAHGFNSLILVTSPSHIRRARYVFRKVMPDSKLECVKSDTQARFLKSVIRHFLEVAKLGKDSILLNLDIKRTNFIETR